MPRSGTPPYTSGATTSTETIQAGMTSASEPLLTYDCVCKKSVCGYALFAKRHRRAQPETGTPSHNGNADPQSTIHNSKRCSLAMTRNAYRLRAVALAIQPKPTRPWHRCSSVCYRYAAWSYLPAFAIPAPARLVEAHTRSRECPTRPTPDPRCATTIVHPGWSFNTGQHDLALCLLDSNSSKPMATVASGRQCIGVCRRAAFRHTINP